MTISARKWAWKVLTYPDPETGAQVPLLPQEKLTLAFLAEMENAEEGYAFPGQELIAEETCQGLRSVRRHLKSLENIGAIEIHKTRKSKSGKWLNNVYVLNVGPAFRAQDAEWKRYNT
ncbi:helix-turn-helix domain-containing protein [Agreia sp. PsM10]|uniref:helix-turn-helix domain-containing protein n=1 Tax=Agreia sp. PsM10 TaxID=3030533 RepID=UPI00263A7474|nr:helix-turn-helix domain-containing protein [Agreia sp. PsM10]MDN4639695.1 helix-turn-helix domain-containing protein [Agreia sp. PsM10]